MTSAAERSTFPILEVGEGVIEVKATNGDTHLGGDNIDQRIVEWLVEEFKKEEGLDLLGKGNEMACNACAMQRSAPRSSFPRRWRRRSIFRSSRRTRTARSTW